MTAKKKPRSKTRQNSEQPHHTPTRSSYASTERFEREVGKFGGRHRYLHPIDAPIRDGAPNENFTEGAP